MVEDGRIGIFRCPFCRGGLRGILSLCEILRDQRRNAYLAPQKSVDNDGNDIWLVL